ncbi:MAG TPA: antitoxin Xre/MbcA/ParS toxin-binding domain-containing protein [Candidatus Limnocylindrales bacterium]|jgi:putative toxin-antitoxin system antitoxin component (TIGR02293 family)|nr:antitoxin Xre/MbcA/ParS toxin-binding domain-containing protein [Candidatus Limnocylindrales bacterium]
MSGANTKVLRVAFPAAGSRRVMRFRGRGASLGLGASNTAELIQQIERGFSFATLRTLEVNSGLALSLLASILGIPERILARRKTAGKLAPDESERLLRVSNLFEKCVELFEGDVTAAVNWLTTPKKALNQERPLMYARTEFGAREVEDLIGRLEHGVFS